MPLIFKLSRKDRERRIEKDKTARIHHVTSRPRRVKSYLYFFQSILKQSSADKNPSKRPLTGFSAANRRSTRDLNILFGCESGDPHCIRDNRDRRARSVGRLSSRRLSPSLHDALCGSENCRGISD